MLAVIIFINDVFHEYNRKSGIDFYNIDNIKITIPTKIITLSIKST